MVALALGKPRWNSAFQRRRSSAGIHPDSGASVECFPISEEIIPHPASTLLQETHGVRTPHFRRSASLERQASLPFRKTPRRSAPKDGTSEVPGLTSAGHQRPTVTIPPKRNHGAR
jgi:hypothetical protein